MHVSEAVAARRSIRRFLPTPVTSAELLPLVERAARAPSGGNVQPWRIYVVGSEAMPGFLAGMADRPPEQAGYEIYPPSLWEPHRSSRFAVGEQMYAHLGIARDDRAGRFAWMAENFRFFGAPAAVFCFVDRRMGPPQWSDLGMYLQTFMLLVEEAGLGTCPQEAWSMWSQAVAELVGAPEEEMLFCGVAVGHPDPDAQVNRLVSERLPTEAWVQVVPPTPDADPSTPTP